jgi:hypothetical protein
MTLTDKKDKSTITTSTDNLQDQDNSATNMVAENNNNTVAISQEQFNILRNAGKASLKTMIDTTEAIDEHLKSNFADVSNSMKVAGMAMETAAHMMVNIANLLERKDLIRKSIKEETNKQIEEK